MAGLILLGTNMLKGMILNWKNKRGKDRITGIQKRLNKSRYLVQWLLQTKEDSLLHTHVATVFTVPPFSTGKRTRNHNYLWWFWSPRSFLLADKLMSLQTPHRIGRMYFTRCLLAFLMHEPLWKSGPCPKYSLEKCDDTSLYLLDLFLVMSSSVGN